MHSLKIRPVFYIYIYFFQQMAPSLVSISRSMLRMSHAALLDLTTLVPLKHINADLSNENEVLARIHEIVLE